MRHGKAFRVGHRSRGFSLFEMVVVICAIVILYMVAEERLNELPGAAERANFYAVMEQIKTGVSFEMVNKLAAGGTGEIRALEGTNPMKLLIEGPSNYEGELARVTDAVERRNAWYFETDTGELVYVVGGASIPDVLVTIAGRPVNYGQIRFKIMNVYDEEEAPQPSASALSRDSSRQPAQIKKWQALLLRPVNEFVWERRAEQPIPLN